MELLEICNSLKPAFFASDIDVPKTILPILAQCIALKHIGQGSVVEYISQPERSIVFSFLHACLIAFISA